MSMVCLKIYLVRAIYDRAVQHNMDGDDDDTNDDNDDDKDDDRCVGRSGLSNQYSGRGSAHVLRTSNAFLNSLPLIMTVL